MAYLSPPSRYRPGSCRVRWGLVALLSPLLTCTSSAGLFQDIVLASHGKALACIVAAPELSLAEQSAALELKAHLDRVTRGDFKLVAASADPRQTRILIGPTAEVRGLLPDVPWDSLKADSVVIRTVGPCLVLAGDRPRGTLYAVYTFLEEQVGCRWWSPAADEAPQRLKLSVRKGLNRVYAPPFAYRSILCKYMEREPGPFGARLKLNGDFPTPAECWGGHQSTIKMGHSFHYLLPPQTYFGPHPEWYGMYNGTRAATTASGRPNQLCLANAEMRQEMVKRALQLIEAEPSAGVISVGQEDGTPPCTCTACLALDAERGGQTGTLLGFVNQVADAIAAVHPRIMVETLAYQWSINPPTVPTRVRDNVLIRIAPINTDFATPLDSRRNAAFDSLLQGWRKVAANLAIYDYAYNYHNQLTSFPFWNLIGANARYYAANSVTSVIYEGDDFNQGTNFVRLRAWLMAHCLWDPRADQQALTRQFLTGYYGAAGPYLGKYIDLTARAAVENTTFMACWSDDACFLTPPQLKRARTCFDKAEAAVAGDPVRTERVKLERLAFDHLLLLSRLVMPEVSDFVSEAERDQRALDFITRSAASGNDFMTATVRLRDDYGEILTGRKEIAVSGQTLPATRRPAATPALCANLHREDWSDIQEGQFMLGALCSLVEDGDASNGVAVRMPAGPYDWVLQAPVFSRNCLGPDAELCVAVKLGARQLDGLAFDVKVYNLATGEYALGRTVRIAEAAARTGYAEIALGKVQLSAAQYIVFVPLDNTAGIESITVDRFFVVRRH